MNRNELVSRVKSNVRDFDGNTFKEKDIINYINESIDRVKQIIPELNAMEYLNIGEDTPILLPNSYHHLLSVYSTARCFAQDERHYQAATLMNEFEVKLQSLRDDIYNGDIIITDKYGDELDIFGKPFYVYDNYFNKKNFEYDDTDGVV